MTKKLVVAVFMFAVASPHSAYGQEAERCRSKKLLHGYIVAKVKKGVYEIAEREWGVIGTYCEEGHSQSSMNHCNYARTGWKPGQHAVLTTSRTEFKTTGAFSLCIDRRVDSMMVTDDEGAKQRISIYYEYGYVFPRAKARAPRNVKRKPAKQRSRRKHK